MKIRFSLKAAILFSVLSTSLGLPPAVSGQTPAVATQERVTTPSMLTMSADSPQAAEVKAEIDRLMDHASDGKMDILETIYHPDMKIFMFSPELKLTEQTKQGFIAQLKKMVEQAKPSRWAQYHKVEANEKFGHVLISRKFRDDAEKPTLTLSIDLVHEDGRWQITREVIFMH